MGWVDKSPHVLIRRRYHCDVCDHTFEQRHQSADEPMPDCPKCVEAGQAAVAGSLSYIPPMPAIGTSKGKAIDLAQKMAEEDFGLTNFADNQRVGDIAVLPEAPMQTADREAALRQMVEMESQAGVAAPLPDGPLAPDGTRQLLVDRAYQRDNYWQGNSGGSAEQTIATQQVAREASGAAAREGVDPLSLLERGRASGSMPLNLNVVAGVAAADLPVPLQQAQAGRGAVT